MANCQISAISDQCGPAQTSKDLSTIPEGRVGQVCKEWLIREDFSAALALQNEEVSQHYKENRFKNRIVREDIPLAKHLQESELIQAQRRRSSYDRFRNDQADTDEAVARQIQRRLWLEEEKARRSAEEADERLAQKLEQREKAKQLKKRAQREKEQVERLSQQIGADYGLESGQTSLLSVSPSTPPSLHSPSFQRILTEDEQELDLSEFCMPPPPGLTPEELKYFLEEQDAEIARLLQHQELKRNKNPEKDKLAVIEAQDFELARMLQKMEKDRVRRIKEKMRAKQQRSQEGGGSGNSNFAINHLEQGTSYQRTSTPISPQNSFDETPPTCSEEHEYDIPENHLHNEAGDADSITYEEPYQLLQQSDLRPQRPFHNIAIDLDPTYQRRLVTSPSSSLQLSAGPSASNLLESCVDDEDDTASSRHFGLLRSNDSLEKHHRSNNQRPPEVVTPPVVVSSTSSSRSSRTSSSSQRSQRSSPNNHQIADRVEPDDYAPPLPPRDVSLLSRQKLHTQHISESRSIPPPPPAPAFAGHGGHFLPPHHPQHPNRRHNGDSGADACTSSQSPNRASIYSTTSASVFIQGHRRVSSMEKQKKEKHKSQDGCKTQ